MSMEITIQDDLLSFLRTHSVCHIATMTEKKTPHVSTVYYHVTSTLIFYIITLSETEKYKNIQKNSHVSLVVSDEVTLETVQIEGQASEIHDPDERFVMFQIVARVQTRNKASSSPPISKLNKGSMQVLMIKPSRIRYSNFKKGKNVIRFDQNFPLQS